MNDWDAGNFDPPLDTKKLSYVTRVPIEMLIDEGMEPPPDYMPFEAPKLTRWQHFTVRATYKMWGLRRRIAKRIDPSMESYDDQGF